MLLSSFDIFIINNAFSYYVLSFGIITSACRWKMSRSKSKWILTFRSRNGSLVKILFHGIPSIFA